jgi:hypothetical protein
MDKTAEVTQGPVLTLTPRHVMAFHKLNLGLADFLNQAFDDPRNAAQVRADIMLGQVAVRTLNYLDIVSEPEPEQAGVNDCAQACTCDHDPLEIAYERYVGHIAGHSERTVAALPPVTLGLISKERFDFILKVHGLSYPELVVLADEGNPEIKAWNTARANRRKELQRIGVLFFLGWQIPPKTPGVLRQRVEGEVVAVLEYLLNRVSGFLEVEKELAHSLGGKALEQTTVDQLEEASQA